MRVQNEDFFITVLNKLRVTQVRIKIFLVDYNFRTYSLFFTSYAICVSFSQIISKILRRNKIGNNRNATEWVRG